MSHSSQEILIDLCRARIAYNQTLIEHVLGLQGEEVFLFLKDYCGNISMDRTLSESQAKAKFKGLIDITIDIYEFTLATIENKIPGNFLRNYYVIKTRCEQTRRSILDRGSKTSNYSINTDVLDQHSMLEILDIFHNMMPEYIQQYIIRCLDYTFIEPNLAIGI